MSTFGPIGVRLPSASLPFGPALSIIDPPRDPVLVLAFNGSLRSATDCNIDADVDEVNFGNAAALSASANKRTYHFRILPLATANTRRFILGKWDWSAAQGELAIHQANATGRRLRVDFSNAAGGDTIAGSCTVDTDVLTLNAWNDVTVVYDGAGASQLLRCLIYVNNVLVSRTPSGTIPATLITGTSRLRAGRWNGNTVTGTHACPMLLSDVRVWGNVALSAAEVATLHTSGTTATAATARWQLNGDLQDSIGANHATSTPAAPAGPGFVCRTQTFPRAGGSRVEIIADSNTANLYWLREFVAYLWHQYGTRVTIGSRYAAAAADAPASYLARYPRHSALSGKEIGATADQANSMRLHGPSDVVSSSARSVIIMAGTNDINEDAAAGAGNRVLGYLASLLTELRVGALATVTRPILFCSILTRTVPAPVGGFDNTAENAIFNAGLPALETSEQAAGRNCVHVNAGERETERGLGTDGVHGGDVCGRKMGAAIAPTYNTEILSAGE